MFAPYECERLSFRNFIQFGILRRLTLNTDPYLTDRIGITENFDNTYLLEINGICPLCGAYVLKSKGKRINKCYEIAHIYPNSPTNAEVKELQGLERLGINCESFENKIALCIPCHNYYDDHKTKEEYVKLLNIKKMAMNLSNAKIAVSDPVRNFV